MCTDLHSHKRRAELALSAMGLGGVHREMAPLVLLAFMGLRPGDPWHAASSPRLTITAVMQFMASAFGVAYAPNTRESVRFSVVNPFVAAGVLVPNPDAHRPKQSPKFCYQLHPATAEILRLLQ